MKPEFFLLCLVLLLAFSYPVYAAPSSAVIEQQSERLLREQQQQLKMQERERNLKELERSLIIIETPLPQPVPLKEAPAVCFNIKKIELHGADNLFSFEKQALVEPYLNRCLNANDIDKLRVDIDRYYIEKGWILSRSYLLPEQNLKEGVLIFKVLEGRLDSIKLNENDLGDRLQIMMAFPHMIDEVVYIRDIEQGLEQMNRLASNQAKMDVVPVKDRPGYGRIVINNQPQNRFRYYLGYDNLGSDSTGLEQARLTADMDNLLNLNDNCLISASRYTGTDTEEKDSDSFTANFSFPLGYWTVNLYSNSSSYLSTVSDSSGSFKLSGDSDTNNLKLSRVVHRDKYGKTSMGMDLSLKANNSYLEDVRLDTSSRKLTVFTIDAQHMSRKPGSIWSFSLAYARGLDLFDALEDGPVRDDDVPRAQFEKWGMDISTVLSLESLGKSLSYRGVLSGQITRDPLFGSEQISLGDIGTIRGFRNSPVSGDSGIYLRNDLVWTSLAETGMTKGMSVSLGLDSGYVAAKNENIADSGEADASLTGVSLGIQQSISWTRQQQLSWSATYARPLDYPDYIEKDSNIFYASVNWKWW